MVKKGEKHHSLSIQHKIQLCIYAKKNTEKNRRFDYLLQ